MSDEQITFRQFLLQDKRANGIDQDLVFLLEDIARRVASSLIMSVAVRFRVILVPLHQRIFRAKPKNS